MNTINLTNDSGSFYTVLINDALSGAANALQVHVSNDTIGSINAGGVAGTAGYATWNIDVQGATADTVAAGLLGGPTKPVNLTDSGGGSLRLNQNFFFFGSTSSVTTVNGSAMKGALTITGQESGTSAS